MVEKKLEVSVCLHCNKDFIKKSKIVKFCSRSCGGINSAKARAKKDRPVVDCLYCGKEIKSRYIAKFCNSSCSAKYNNPLRNLEKEDRSIECLNCGKVKYTVNRVYCSRECLRDYTKKRIKEGICKDPVTIKKYLCEERGENCEECGLSNEWNGKKLTLQMDHIDGNADNNNLENLRIVCPNCHTQTPTYGSKNKGMTSSRNKYMRDYRESFRKP